MISRSRRHQLRMVVIDVLVKAREEWAHMDERQRKSMAKHAAAIAKYLDECATTGATP